MKCFAETIFADQGNLLATPFTVSLISRRLIFAVPDQSVKNAKIWRLENLALYGIPYLASFFSSWKYFRTALVDRKFVTLILFHYKKISPSKNFLIWIFRTGTRTRGVNSQRCEVELKSALSVSVLAHYGSVP